jgi:hypothetical protein
MSCFTNKPGGGWREIAAVFCPACYYLLNLLLGAVDRDVGMPVSAEIARTVMPAARLVSQTVRATVVAAAVVSVFTVHCTTRNAHSGTETATT